MSGEAGNTDELTSAEKEAHKELERRSQAITHDDLPSSPEKRAGVVMMPSMRIDGSYMDAPWNVPEPILWDNIRKATLHKTDDFYTNNSCVVAYKNNDEHTRKAIFSFEPNDIHDLITDEYNINKSSYDLTKRKLAFYELAKALGMEDIAPPCAARKPIDGFSIPGKGTKVCIVEVLPLNAENFAEKWASLGYDHEDRMNSASAKLRYSIYRAMYLDYVAGTSIRMMPGSLHNRSSDCIALYDSGVCFPDPRKSADRFLRLLSLGWSEAMKAPTQNFSPPGPPNLNELIEIAKSIDSSRCQELYETILTVNKSFTPKIYELLGKILIEHGVPENSVAGMMARVAYSREESPGVISEDPFLYTRDFLLKLRLGEYGARGNIFKKVIDFTNSSMKSITGSSYDIEKYMSDN